MWVCSSSDPRVGAGAGTLVQSQNMIMGDFMWAVFCIVAVWLYMAVHLQSLILATVGMYEIVMSFPVAYFFYRAIFQVGSQSLHLWLVAHRLELSY